MSSAEVLFFPLYSLLHMAVELGDINMLMQMFFLHLHLTARIIKK
jgi:hypothetical protein